MTHIDIIKKGKLELENAIKANDREQVYEKAKLLESILDSDDIALSEEWMDAFFYLISLYPQLYEKDNLEGWMNNLLVFFLEDASPYVTRFTQYTSQTAWHYFESGYNEKSEFLCDVTEKLLESVVSKTENIQEEGHIQLLQAIININEVFRCQGRYENLLHWNEKGIELAEFFLYSNRELYLEAINALANLYYHSAHYERAIQLLYSTLINEKCGVLELHEHTAMLINNLAQNFDKFSNYEQTIQVYNKLLDFYSEYPLKCRSSILKLKYDISNQYYKYGYLESALSFQEAVVKGWRGDDSFPKTDFAVVLSSYGNNLMTLGQYDEAEKVIREALEIRKETDGEQSTSYARSLCAMANLYNASRRYDTAREMSLRAREIFSRESEHKVLMIEANISLSNSLKGQKDYIAAEEIIKESIQILQNLNDRNLSLQEAFQHSELARVYEKQGKLEESVEEDLSALRIFRENFSGTSFGYHQLITRPINGLKALQRFEEAVVLIDEVIAFLKEQNEAKEAIMSYLQSKAECHIQMDNLKEGEILLKECLVFIEEKKGRNSQEYVNTLISLIHIYLQSDQLSEAYDLATHALEIAVKLYSPHNLNLLALKSHYGKILFRLDKKEESFHFYSEITFAADGIDTSESVEYGKLIYQMAIDCYQEENYKSALLLLKQVREIQDSFLSEDDPKRKIINDAIIKLENQLDNNVPDGFVPFTENSENPEHVNYSVYTKCLTAFLREDYHLCLRMGRPDYYGVETAFLVLLSYLYLEQAEEATEYGRIIEKILPEGTHISSLYRLIMGKTKIEECLATAQSDRQRCGLYMYYGASLVARGKVEDGTAKLKTAITFKEENDNPYVESVYANQILQNIKNGKLGKEIANIYNELHDLTTLLLEQENAGDLEKYMNTTLKIKDTASILGKEHPAFGDALLLVARANIMLNQHAEANSLLRRGLNVLFSFFPGGHQELQNHISGLFNFFSTWSDKTQSQLQNKYLFAKRLLILLEKDHNDDLYVFFANVLLELSFSEYYQELHEEGLAVFKGIPVFETLTKLATRQITIEDLPDTIVTERHHSMAHFIEAQKQIKNGDFNDALGNINEVIRYNASGVEHNYALLQKGYLEEQLEKANEGVSTASLVEELEKAFTFIDQGLIEKAYELAKNIELLLKREEAQELAVSAKAYYELGTIYFRCSLPDDAIAVYEEAMDKFLPDNYYYVFFQMGLGSSYLSKKEHNKARSILEDAYKLFIEKKVKVSIGFKDLLFSLVNLNKEISEMGKAEMYCKELIETTAALSGEESQDYSLAQVLLVTIFYSQRKLDEAQDQAKRAYEISNRFHARNSIPVIHAIITLARLTFTSDRGQGEKFLEEGVLLIFDNYSPDEMYFFTWLFDSISIYYDNCQYEKAIGVATKILEIIKTGEEKYQQEGYRCYKIIADSLHGQESYMEAMEYRNYARDTASALFGDESHEYASCLEMQALTYEAMGEKEKSEALLNKAINIIYKVQI